MTLVWQQGKVLRLQKTTGSRRKHFDHLPVSAYSAYSAECRSLTCSTSERTASMTACSDLQAKEARHVPRPWPFLALAPLLCLFLALPTPAKSRTPAKSQSSQVSAHVCRYSSSSSSFLTFSPPRVPPCSCSFDYISARSLKLEPRLRIFQESSWLCASPANGAFIYRRPSEPAGRCG